MEALKRYKKLTNKCPPIRIPMFPPVCGQGAASRTSQAPSLQNLNDRKRDRYGNGERNEEITRHSHRLVFTPRPLRVIPVALQVSASSSNGQPREYKHSQGTG